MLVFARGSCDHSFRVRTRSYTHTSCCWGCLAIGPHGGAEEHYNGGSPPSERAGHVHDADHGVNFTSLRCILDASPGGISWMGASSATVPSKVSKAEDHCTVSVPAKQAVHDIEARGIATLHANPIMFQQSFSD